MFSHRSMSTRSPGNARGQSQAVLVVGVSIVSALLLATVFHFSIQNSFGFLLVLVLFVIAFTRIHLALLILIFSMLLSPEIETGGISGRSVVIRIEDILLVVVFLGWMARMALQKEIGLLKKTPLNLPIGLYVFFCVLSTGMAIVQSGGFGLLRQSFFYLLKYFEYFLLYFMVVNNLHTLKQAKLYIYALLATCVVVSVYAAANIPGGERLSAPFEGKGGEPNTFAAYLLFMLGLMGGQFLYNRSIRQRAILLAMIVVAAVVFVLTLSRGGWIGFAPMFLTFVFLNKRYRYLLLAFFLVLVIALPSIMPAKVQHRLTETFSNERSYEVLGKRYTFAESAAHRIDSWRKGVDMWLEKPLFGWGIPSGNVIDNQYTRVLTETGFFGFLAYLWLLMAVFRVCWGTAVSTDDTFAKGLAVGAIAGFVGLLTNALASATFILIRVMEPFWFTIAVVVALPQLLAQEQEQPV